MISRVFLVLCLLIPPGCGGGDGGGFSLDGTTVSDAGPDVGTPGDVPEPPDTGPEPVPASLQQEWITSGPNSLYAESYVPSDCIKDSPCPAIVLVPDQLMPGIEQFSCCAGELARKMHAVVVTYNPPGRGSGGQLSGGEEDFGGTVAQDALKDVANHFRKKGLVDADDFGIISVGDGLADAAGAIARFHGTSLDFVDWLIDIEGPTNRCFITQSPFYHPPEKERRVNGDGPGVSTTRCDFNLNLRKEKFPAGTSSDGKGTDGTPTSYICNTSSPVLLASGKECGDDKWWQSREAKTYLPDISVHYLRIQFLHDHRQPTRYNAREALHWVTQSDAPTYQINNVSVDSNLKGYGEEELVKAGVYLKPKAGNGFGTDVFDDNGDFSQLTPEELYLSVLPSHIKKMRERAGQ
ncbi:MAG: hypothetical protein FJ109_02550 [Deltaproteobacteria bacterium]|nr:hypothetical protein [Deltaproteobacteria bacterium]